MKMGNSDFEPKLSSARYRYEENIKKNKVLTVEI